MEKFMENHVFSCFLPISCYAYSMKNTSGRERAEQLLNQMRQLGMPMKASVVIRRFRCGKPGCHCAKGKRHQDMIVTRNKRGKTQTIRVMRGREDQALEWVGNWRKLKAILAKLTAVELKILRMPATKAGEERESPGE